MIHGINALQFNLIVASDRFAYSSGGDVVLQVVGKAFLPKDTVGTESALHAHQTSADCPLSYS